LSTKPYSLINQDGVLCALWSHTPIKWVDGFTGEEHTHLIDLTIVYVNGAVKHFDFADKSYPLTKYLYAQNAVENWELISNEEKPFKW